MDIRDIKADLISMRDRGVDPVVQFDIIAKHIDAAFEHGAAYQMVLLHKHLFPNCKEAQKEVYTYRQP